MTFFGLGLDQGARASPSAATLHALETSFYACPRIRSRLVSEKISLYFNQLKNRNTFALGGDLS